MDEEQKKSSVNWEIVIFLGKILLVVLVIISFFDVVLHALGLLKIGDSYTTEEFFKFFFKEAGNKEMLALAYMVTAFIFSVIYKVLVTIPAIAVFLSLDDPVISVFFIVFIVFCMFDLYEEFINGNSGFHSTKHALSAFTGTLVKEKFKSLKKWGTN